MSTITQSIVRVFTSAFALPWIDSHPERDEPEVLIMFPDNGNNYLYQLTQWFKTMNRLDSKINFALVIASPEAESCVSNQKGFRVITLSKRTLLPDYLRASKPKVLLYLNKNLASFQAWRYNHGIHAFVGHGESDKAYMSQNTIKFFDYYLAAGPAAYERMKRDVSFYDTSTRMIEVGRPQIDDVYDAPDDFRRGALPVILYAPTWEGVTKQTRYSSVLSHGQEIVRAIIDSGKFQLIYRPHPLVGSNNPDYAKANDLLINLLAKSNRESGTHHRFDQGEFGWQLDASDLMITDVSAVAYDWLSTGKPLIMTKPEEEFAEVDKSGLISELNLLEKAQLGGFLNILVETLNDPTSRKTFENWRKYYFGDHPKGSNTDLLVQAIEQLTSRAAEIQEQHDHIQYDATPARGASLGLLRYVNFGLKETAGRLIRQNTKLKNVKALRGSEVLISNSDPFDSGPTIAKIDRLLKLNPDKKYVLLTNQSSTYIDALVRFNLLNKSLNSRFTVILSQDAATYEKHLIALKPVEVLYLKHHMLNHLAIRRNGIKHVLLWPELDKNFVLDRSITVFDEVRTTTLELQEQIIDRIFFPGKTNAVLERST
jgi:CDP-glycerol glycerophosphotransferase (TagB/SpsB family)